MPSHARAGARLCLETVAKRTSFATAVQFMPHRIPRQRMQPMRLFLIATLLAAAFAGPWPIATPVFAQTNNAPATDDVAPEADIAGKIAALGETLQIGPLIAVMREEGLVSGQKLAKDMLPDAGDRRWSAILDGIYDAQAMKAVFDARFAAELGDDPETVAAAAAFFGSERGQRILTLEIEARRAMLDDAVTEAAKVLAQDMFADDDPRITLLQDFAEAADLVDLNVTGGLNGNFAFMKGMADAGGPAAQLTEDEMLADVWGGERNVRAQTTEWLYSYFALAYQPLSDTELQDYADFWRTPAGKKTNAALFAAFNELFTGISGDLGRATARQLQGDDI
jgi:Uncharacterized protein conserved in bacteria (DUF2059)